MSLFYQQGNVSFVVEMILCPTFFVTAKQSMFVSEMRNLRLC